MSVSRRLSFILLLAALCLPRSAAAVDLATAFGVAGAGFPAPRTFANDCHFQATHAGNPSLGQVNITANGTDSAVITLLCSGVSFTGTLPSIDVNGHQVSSVAFPQIVTSSAAGVWTVTVAGQIQFTVTAQ